MNEKNGMETNSFGPRWRCVATISCGRSWVALLLTGALLCGCASREGTAIKTGGRAGNKLIVSPAKAGESSSQRLAAALAQAARQHEQSGSGEIWQQFLRQKSKAILSA